MLQYVRLKYSELISELETDGGGLVKQAHHKAHVVCVSIRVAKHQFSWQFNYMTITHAKRG